MKINVPTPEQRRAADPATSAWVAANAGSGKTHVLVDRVIRLMLDGAEPETILCLTFTKAAAAEMQTRLFKRLGEWTLAGDDQLGAALTALGLTAPDAQLLATARRLFTRALETPGGLRIQTIHAFAEKLLKLFPVEAGIAPDFQVLEERQATELLSKARDGVLQSARTLPECSEAKAMARVEPYCSEDLFDSLLEKLIAEAPAITWALDASDEDLRRGYFAAVGLQPHDTLDSLRERALDFDRTELDALILRLSTFDTHYGFRAGDALRAVISAPTQDAALAALRSFACKKSESAPRSDDRFIAKGDAADNPDMLPKLLALRDRAMADLEACDLALQADASAALLTLATATHRRYAAVKTDQSLHDFDDLIRLAAALLSTQSSAAWVLQKLDKRLNHILVDEAQDTSPAQWLIVQALSEEFFSGQGARDDGMKRTLFVVGDRKQSIYSFQGADVQSFEAVRQGFAQRIASANQRFPDIPLRLSYRSAKTILDFVDATFPPESLAAMGFERDLGDEGSGHSPTRDTPGLVQVWPLVTSLKQAAEADPLSPVDEEPDTAHRSRLAGMLARTLKSWIGKRLLSGTDRPVSPGDIMILFRSRSPLFDQLIAELRKTGVPVAGADRLTLRDSLAVNDLLLLAQVLLLPDDDHGLACVLKSPLVPFALDDNDLIDLAARRGEASLWQALAASVDSKAMANMRWLEELQAFRETCGPYGLFSLVLSRSRRAMAQRLGPEALDASDALLDSALDFERMHGPSLPAFHAWFMADENVIKREMEQGHGLVRLITVHGSKGLEAPIVILADAANARNSKRDDLIAAPDGHPAAGLPLWTISGLMESAITRSWKDHADMRAGQEHLRLLYVAMTRARDELYVCGSCPKNEAPDSSWYAFIHKALGRPHTLPAATPVQFDGIDFTGLQFGDSPGVAGAAEHVTARKRPPLPSWISKLAGEEITPAAPEDAAGPRHASIRAALAAQIRDPLAHVLLGPDVDLDVQWAARSASGALTTGYFDRLAVRTDMVVALTCQSEAGGLLPDNARAVLSTAYPDRRIMTGMLSLQSGQLDWV